MDQDSTTLIVILVLVGWIGGQGDTPACQEDPTGVNYRGNLSQTINNHTCQAWTSQYPQQHDRTPANYPNAGLDDNYCRNPDNVDTAWCYTTNSGIRWEYCAVGFLDPRCQATTEPATNPTTPTPVQPETVTSQITVVSTPTATTEPTTNPTTTTPVQSETVTSQTTVGPIQDDSTLGLESGAIPDSSLTAFSEWDANHGPFRGRLNIARVGLLRGGWSAKTNDLNQWIQVDLLATYNIVGVATQGRQDLPQWVTSYKIACSMNSVTFDTVKDPVDTNADNIFPGNSDQNTVVYNRFPVPILCRYVRLLPYTWYAHISLRMELYGELLAPTEASTTMDTTMEDLQSTAGETTVYLETTQSDQGTTSTASTTLKTSSEGSVAMNATTTKTTPPQLQAPTEASTTMDTTMEDLQSTAGETTVYLETTQSDQGTTSTASTTLKTSSEGSVAMNPTTTKTTPPQLQGVLRVLADLNEAESVTFGISMPMILYFTFLMLALLLRCIVLWIRGLNKKEVEPDQERPRRMYELVRISY